MIPAAKHGPIELLEQPVVAAGQDLVRRGEHHVPIHGTSLDLARPAPDVQCFTGRGGEGFEVGLVLRLLQRAIPAHDREGPGESRQAEEDPA